MLWTLSADAPAMQLSGELHFSPWASIAGQQQDCETIYCDEAGNPLSGWSGFNFIIP
jgi:hypothetical protein